MAAKKKAAVKKPMNKTEILTALAEGTGLSKKDVASVLTELGILIGKSLGKRGPGVFNLSGLMKVKVIRKPATKTRKRINPFGSVGLCSKEATSEGCDLNFLERLKLREQVSSA